jgi:hypothetical protein
MKGEMQAVLRCPARHIGDDLILVFGLEDGDADALDEHSLLLSIGQSQLTEREIASEIGVAAGHGNV